MTESTLRTSWITSLRQRIQQPAASARAPLLWNGIRFGSVAPHWMAACNALACAQTHGFALRWDERNGGGWHVDAPNLSEALNALAHHARQHGMTGPWRNEQLDVFADTTGAWLGTVERGAVRVLGIATNAVHLLATTPDGAMWVQQRAHNKPTYPGRWDTLMGGMVSAGDDLAAALARETLEEAGLHLAQLQAVQHGGAVAFDCPCDEGGKGLGHMREHIHWYQSLCTPDVEPRNIDGEVAQFQCIPQNTLQTWVLQNRFTPEASLVLADYWGW